MGIAVMTDPEHFSLIDAEMELAVSSAVVVVEIAIPLRGGELVGVSSHVVF